MTTAAPVILNEMNAWIALGGTNLGIVGDKNHSTGFHRGANDVSSHDYSRYRDPNGSDGPYVNWNYACAGDFAHNGNERLRAMHRQVLNRLRNGELPMICEFIGQPWADQPVYYWARWNGVKTLRRYTGRGHDHWSHISWYRSRVDEPAKLWTPSTVPTLDWTEKLIMSLPTIKTGDRGIAVRRLQGLLIAAGSTDSRVDGNFGSLTQRAVLREQAQAGIAADGIVGRNTWTKLLGQ